MSLPKDEKKLLMLEVKDLIFTINKQVIAEHIKTCPVGRSIMMTKSLLIGICIGVGLCGSGLGFTVAKFLL